jgi:two-component system cell cycle response regulator DivK
MPTDDQPSVSEPKTVLIVEDNDLTLRFVRDLLELNGYLVLTATSGEPVIELAREQNPDLILLDIQLPDISGMEVARQLKADAQTRAIPIIAATALAMSGDRRKILASGCDDYIAKPFKGEDLLRLLQRHIG